MQSDLEERFFPSNKYGMLFILRRLFTAPGLDLTCLNVDYIPGLCDPFCKVTNEGTCGRAVYGKGFITTCGDQRITRKKANSSIWGARVVWRYAVYYALMGTNNSEITVCG